jgi:hypothetical protein
LLAFAKTVGMLPVPAGPGADAVRKILAIAERKIGEIVNGPLE